MKKICLLIFLMFQMTFVYGQGRDNVGHRVGPWNFGTPQKGIAWKIRRSYYSENSEKFTNEIELKNTTNSIITFSYNISENSNETTTRYRKTLARNETYTSTYCPNAQSVYFFVNLSNEQVTNQQTTQQNNLTDYNNSKADIERKMAAKNAESQTKSQNYTNAMNSGISAHNSGNYAEAKRQFSIALNNWNTEEARQKAQEYYNKSVDANKSQANIQAVGGLVAPALNTISEISKAIRESKNQKEEINEIRLKNDMKDENFFKAYVADVILTFKDFNEEPISIDVVKSNVNGDGRMQTIHYNDFSIDAIFVVSNNIPGIKSLQFVCNNKEVWDRIKSYKMYKKWQRPTYKNRRVENQEYAKIMVMLVDYDRKKIKNYEFLVNEYSNYIGKIKNNKELLDKENILTINEGLNLTDKELYLKGVDSYKQKDLKNANKYYDLAVQKGSTDAMVSIGNLYYGGEGVTQDYEKAKQWYINAANLNNTDGMLCLGYLYSENEGYPPDLDEATKWFSKASESGNKGGLFEIGDLYYQGDIVEKDYKKALEFFFDASNYNNISAIMRIAVMYEKGIGVEKSSEKAKEWYKKSCELGITFDCDKIKN